MSELLPPSHELKCHEQFYVPIIEGRKTFEVRDKKDRWFYEGEHLLLREVRGSNLETEYTGRACLAEVMYILPSIYSFDGLPTNTAIMAIKVIEKWSRQE